MSSLTSLGYTATQYALLSSTYAMLGKFLKGFSGKAVEALEPSYGHLGAFATALGAGLPILPVGIAGTYAIWPKGAFRLRRGPVVIKVGRPIPTDGLSYDDHTALRDRTFESVARLRAEARSSLWANGSDPGGID